MAKVNRRTKVLSMAMAASMIVSLCPTTVYAVSGSQVAKDGTYSAPSAVKTENGGEDFEDYGVNVKLTVKDGLISDVAVTTDGAYDADENGTYLGYALNGRTRKGVTYPGIKEALVGKSATEESVNGWDAVSGATYSSKAVKTAALEAIQSAPEAAASVDTTDLEVAIQTAKALTESDYTAESWEAMQAKLAAAETALTKKESQTAVDAAKEELAAAVDALVKADTKKDAYVYAYAAIPYSEYWASEGVLNGSSAASSEEIDINNEHDKGAFDAVSRATTNHGLYRGSFQQWVTIYLKDGPSFDLAYFDEGVSTQMVTTDGKAVTYANKQFTIDGETYSLDHYTINGIKYVPVKVAAEDYDAFKEAYTVVENGEALTGGSTNEGNVKYYNVTAEVTADTNGLKTATKNADGSFSFGPRQTGTDSGIKGQELQSISQTALDSVKVVDSSKFGDSVRVDITEDYGDLGAKMQTVEWKYYGSNSTDSEPLATYGTKFAADDWMHSKNGIQLGLTESDRFVLPEGTDGTGTWTATIYALGYTDTTLTVQVTADDIHTAHVVSDYSKLEAAVAEAKTLNEDDYTADTWANFATELGEAETTLAAAKGESGTSTTQEAVDEDLEHLQSATESLQLRYVLMNIPYAEFYAADVKNDVKVDAFSSATLNKTRTGSLAGGSYHVNADGSDITGVTFPVKISDDTDLSKYTQITDESSVDITVTNKGKTSTTTYTGKDALFESASYSYYRLSEVPSYYKEVSVNEDGSLSFGAVKGEVTKVTAAEAGITPELLTESSYGDYQLNMDGITSTKEGQDALLTKDGQNATVYAVIVSTEEGSDYGMRHLENIWRVSELAWCTGFTDAVHNCKTSSAHYAAMMGQTINKVTYYTSEGIYEISVDGIYVPVKFESGLSVQNASVTAGSTAMSVTLPADFDPVYRVDGLDGAAVADGKLSYGSAQPGEYTLTVTDQSGKYADISTTFVLSTDKMPAAYDGEKKALVQAEDATADEFAAYLAKITSVKVNGKDYAATGRGATTIINADGTLKTDAEPITAAGTYEITVTATGYETPLTFTYVVEEPAVEVNTASLEKAIADAKALKESDYTADSWKALQTALADAESALSAKESQEKVDAAANTLNDAIAKLAKKSGAAGAGTTANTAQTGGAAKTAGTAAGSNSTNKSGTVRTGDPANALGLLAAAAASLGAAGATLRYRRKRK